MHQGDRHRQRTKLHKHTGADIFLYFLWPQTRLVRHFEINFCNIGEASQNRVFCEGHVCEQGPLVFVSRVKETFHLYDIFTVAELETHGRLASNMSGQLVPKAAKRRKGII